MMSPLFHLLNSFVQEHSSSPYHTDAIFRGIFVAQITRESSTVAFLSSGGISDLAFIELVLVLAVYGPKSISKNAGNLRPMLAGHQRWPWRGFTNGQRAKQSQGFRKFSLNFREPA